MASPLFFTFYFIFITSSIRTSIAISTNTLNSTQELYDGQTLVFSNQRFEFGFFNLSKSSDRYLGIWYKNLPFTVVWMANRNNPITGNSSSLKLNLDGELVLYNGTMRVWVAADMNVPVKGKILQLLNNGNLVMKHSNDSEDYIWESFNYPSDTLLPDMKLGWNLTTGLHRNMTAWISGDDPSEGEFSFSLDPPDSPQLVLRKGSEKQYRWGPDGVNS